MTDEIQDAEGLDSRELECDSYPILVKQSQGMDGLSMNNNTSTPVSGGMIIPCTDDSVIGEASAEAEDICDENTSGVIQDNTTVMTNTIDGDGINSNVKEVTIVSGEVNVINSKIENLRIHVSKQYTNQEEPEAQETRPPITPGSPTKTPWFVLLPSLNVKSFIKAIKKDTKKYWKSGIKVTQRYEMLSEPGQEFSPAPKSINKFFMGQLKPVNKRYMAERLFSCETHSSDSGSCEDLLKSVLEAKGGTRFAVVGSAGSGKTTSLRRLVRDVCKSPKSPSLVLFHCFHDLANADQITPCDFLFRHLNLSKKDVALGYKWLLDNQDHAIFFFDGLDQATWSACDKPETMRHYDKSSAGVIMSNILNKKLFPGVKVVYTSREHPVASLRGDLRPDKVIALTGLSESDVESLFISLVGDNGKELWEKLIAQSHSLIPLLSIPAFLIFTAIVYKENLENPPEYVTGVMQELLEIFKRSDHINDEDIPRVLKGLKEMSFDGMMNKIVQFAEDQLGKYGLTLKEITAWITEVPTCGKPNQFLTKGDRTLLFSHQVVQESLTANHISGLSLPDFEAVVQNKLIDDYLSVVTRFLSGILLNRKGNANLEEVCDLEQKQEILKEMLASKYRNAKNVVEKLSVLAAISESNDANFIRSLVDEIVLTRYALGATGISLISSVMRHCGHLRNLNLYNCCLDASTAAMLWDNVERSGIKVTRLNFRENNLSPKSLSVIGSILEDNGHLELGITGLSPRDDLTKLRDALGSKKLKHLGLRWNNVSDQSLDVIASMLTDGATLDLMGYYMTLSGFQSFKDALGTRKLKSLILNWNTVVDEHIEDVVSMIAEGGSFGLFSYEITGSALHRIGDALGTKKLTEICVDGNKDIVDYLDIVGSVIADGASVNMWCCDLTPNGLSKFRDATQGKKISALGVAMNKLDRECAAIVGEITKQCSVDELLIFECSLTDDVLATFLSKCEGAKLSMLYIGGNNLSQKAVDSIRQSITVERIFSGDSRSETGKEN